MRIVITGCSGFVGGQLVPMLQQKKIELLLVGRDPAKLAARFPSVECCTYKEIDVKAAGFDRLVHLATLNSDAVATDADFMAANVDLALQTLASAERAGIKQFIYASSFHALGDLKTAYANSKRTAAIKLAETGFRELTVMLMPLVYSQKWGGKLRPFNHLPFWLAKTLFYMLAALKPTLHVQTLAETIVASTLPKGDLLLANNQSKNIAFAMVKKVIDLSFALAIFVVFWWLLVAVWVAIRATSPGPAIFAQQRVGRDGRMFVCYKFRTMKLGTTHDATHKIGADSVTGIGRWLRRTKIDELPQIWNICRNEISLVGPRPCLPSQTELIHERQIRGVFTINPGITGLAQVNGIDMSDPIKLASWDYRYLKSRSLLLDASIILKTVMGKGGGDNLKK